MNCLKPLAALGLLMLGASQALASPTVKQPNILLIVADDLGFSDLSALGSEIQTPNLDKLLTDGRLMLDFHAAPSCSPTRAMLMSGNDPHLAGLGMMAEARKRLPAGAQVRAGYEGVLGSNVATLAELLHDAGYRTYISGKWHLGMQPAQQPQNRGFDQAYVLLEGGAAHFKQANMALQPNYSSTFRHNGEPIELPDDFYSTTWFTDRLIDAIDDGKASNKPFFAFAAYTAPHWPLQAPDEYLAQYRGRYDQGYEVIARERLARQRKAGLVPADFPLEPQLEGVPGWASLTEQQQQQSARTMEVYAAMVAALDAEVGRLVDHLRKTGELDNTLVLFMSDNGPENATRVDPNWIKKNFDTRLANYGRRDSFLMIGSAWAQVSALPSRRYKMTTYQGGIRVPAFVYHPATIKAGRSDELASVRDIMPTLLQLAGAPMPGITYRDRAIVPPQGTSALDYLQGKDTRIHAHDEALGWEINGSASLRKGPMKLLWDATDGTPAWHLYDLSNDPGEHHDIAAAHPRQVSDLLRDWKAYAQRSNIAIDADGRPASPAMPLASKP
ncbi:TPA: arylsulfatase [Pseudomonas putida]|uniref:arylsulfatase n=1 Tax=Pseudomonas putida TaxID=303 RepID=UPI0020C4BC49|nr:arylsulfatase [Pseudomonas putida]UTL83057.1 arylsulfatase [Pseudomonas putida]HEN8711074.1 arylsulfatase [Pseudomonas putida]HEN8714752.1 arylsulfatase [Pseudomonas putida]